ncbi:protein tiptop-like [Amphibalanus amphitrite]|uniref:protein tiptop-like n=1 Tax=Amphibalanus amphitrite TaxID=1232801 RepID=UPI001C91B14F|nr:protein tiptop-like [Amphibalanus amphitrite]
MPRRKQDCPKRMQWEEEQALLAAAAAGAGAPDDAAAAAAVSDDATGAGDDAPMPSDEESECSDKMLLGAATSASWDGAGSRPSSAQSAELAMRSAALGSPPEPARSPPDVLDFSVRRPASTSSEEAPAAATGARPAGDSPLDLSVPRRRPGGHNIDELMAPKQPRLDTKPPTFLSPWDRKFPFPFAGAALPKLDAWNGKPDPEPPSSQKLPPYTKSPTPSEASRALERMQELTKLSGEPSDLFRQLGQRPNVWQNQWMSRGVEQARDVLKCVWCKISFNTLAELTAHMREARHTTMPTPPTIPPSPSTSSVTSEAVSSLKETMPLPRKLVRGQDVWLGKGAEQTRQILKCMWCGQSFKSLDEMTQHMQKTQHYTNIISQEQIISWKSPDTKAPSQSHVNAVLTCKVCDQAFASLKELSNHMVKYSHYKEHIMRSISESGGRRRQTREKRKKSLPVRKLLELERAQGELKAERAVKEGAGKITCEKCSARIDTPLFVEHIRTCPGKTTASKSPSETSNSASDRKTPGDDEEDVPSAATGAGSGASAEAGSADASSSPSAINALERLIEKSLNPRQRASAPSAAFQGASILKRLGIDESVDYSRPLLEAGGPAPRARSGSESSAASEARFDTESDAERPEPERERQLSLPLPLPPLRIEATENGSKELPPAAAAARPLSHSSAASPVGDVAKKSDGSASPAAGSERALTPRSAAGSDRSTPAEEPPAEPRRPGPANPLAALQKLCDKTDTPPPRSGAGTGGAPAQGAPGAILAFSWACNDAVMTDSIMKCAFCDTPFISKGAYRHHLSKMHFVKDGMVPEPATSKASASNKAAAPRSPPSSSNSSVDETSHSKFLKYTELAKQLSSKYVVE